MSQSDFLKDVADQPVLFAQHSEDICAAAQEVAALSTRGRPLLTGIATSLSAWKSVHALMSVQMQNPPTLLNTCDLLDYYYPQGEDDRPLFVMSRSGDSAEIERLVDTIDKDRLLVGITEGANSVLANRAQLTLGYRAEEKAFPNTSSFTLSQLYALAVGVGLGFQLSMPLEALLALLCDKAATYCRAGEPETEIGDLLSGASGVIVEGQGPLTGVVEQYALDFQETQAVGVPVVGGIMRHGAVELTELPGVVTLMLVPDDEVRERKLRLAEELAGAGKPVIVVTDGLPLPGGKARVVRLPSVPDELKSVMFTLAMQKVYGSYVEQKGLSSLQPALVGKITRIE